MILDRLRHRDGFLSHLVVERKAHGHLVQGLLYGRIPASDGIGDTAVLHLAGFDEGPVDAARGVAERCRGLGEIVIHRVPHPHIVEGSFEMPAPASCGGNEVAFLETRRIRVGGAKIRSLFPGSAAVNPEHDLLSVDLDPEIHPLVRGQGSVGDDAIGLTVDRHHEFGLAGCACRGQHKAVVLGGAEIEYRLVLAACPFQADLNGGLAKVGEHG